MAGDAMFGFCTQWLAVQCLDFAPNGWQRNAWTVARCLKLLPDGGMMLKNSARQWGNAENERPKAVGDRE
jgi:hypothetical protein